MPRVNKASEAEQKEYVNDHLKQFGTRPVYPLYGFVKVDGLTCAVEFPNEGRDNPKYEVMAPKGYHFAEGVHSLLCFNMQDLLTRTAQHLEPCSAKCQGDEPSKDANGVVHGLNLLVLIIAALALVGCGGGMTPAPTTTTASVTITAAQVFTPHVGDVWTFKNGYGDITKITLEAVPPSNFIPANSISFHYTKNACRAYWGAGICDALLHFVLSPQPDGSWVSMASLFYFPTQIPDYMNGHHMATSDTIQVPGMPMPYTIVPASATTGITNSMPTMYDRWDESDVLSFDSIISGPAVARVRWQTNSYIENVSTPVYSGPALVSEQFESACIHEKWYFAPGHGLVKVLPLDNGSCTPGDPLLTMVRQ